MRSGADKSAALLLRLETITCSSLARGPTGAGRRTIARQKNDPELRELISRWLSVESLEKITAGCKQICHFNLCERTEAAEQKKLNTELTSLRLLF